MLILNEDSSGILGEIQGWVWSLAWFGLLWLGLRSEE